MWVSLVILMTGISFGYAAMPAVRAADSVALLSMSKEYESRTGALVKTVLTIQNPSGMAAGMVEISFDPAVAVAVEAVAGDLLEDFLFVSNLQEPGKVALAWVDTEKVDKAGILAEITFRLRKVEDLKLQITKASLQDADGGEISFDTRDGAIQKFSGVELNPMDNLPADKEFTIYFNDVLHEMYIDSRFIYVKDAAGKPVDVSVARGRDPESVVVKAPAGGYAPGKSYYLYISDNIESLSGKRMKKPVRMRFTIAR